MSNPMRDDWSGHFDAVFLLALALSLLALAVALFAMPGLAMWLLEAR